MGVWWRGHGHVSNFYTVNLKISPQRYTGGRLYTSRPSLVFFCDTYKTMKTTRTRHGWMHMFITHRSTLTLQLHNFDLFGICVVVRVVSALLRGNRQDFNWYEASRGPSAIAELLVKIQPHLAYVATIPCETLISWKQAIKDKLQGNVATYLRCGGVVQIKKGLLLSVWVNFFNRWIFGKVTSKSVVVSSTLCAWPTHC